MPLLLKEHYNFQLKEGKLQEMREADAAGRPVVVIGVIQRSDQKNHNGRIYPHDILSKEVERYKNEVIGAGNGMGQLDHCLLGENEVLTKDGWKRLDEINGQEVVYTFDKEKNKIGISPILKVHKFFYEGNMLRLTNKKKLDLTMTPNHRMLLWNRKDEPYYITAAEACEKWKNKDSQLSHSKILSSGEWESETEPSYFEIPGTSHRVSSKAWAALFGLWIAEGHVAGSKGGDSSSYEIGIHQKKEENIQKIRDLLFATELNWSEYKNKNGKYVWIIRGDEGIHAYFSQFGNSGTKFIPKDMLNWPKSLLSIMFDWMLLGDGRNRKSPSGELIKEYSTVSEKLANDTSELIFKLGHRSFVKSHQPTEDLLIEGRIVKKENCKKLFTVALNTSSTYMNHEFINFEEVPHKDNVYCITTNQHNFLTRSPNGYVCWTGNTDNPIIELDKVSHVLEDIWWDGPEKKEVWGKIRLLNTPKGLIAKSIVLDGIPLGISSRAVGSVHSEGGCDYVEDDLNLICWDLVGTPSTDNAYLKLHEAKEIGSFDKRKIYPAQLRIKDTLRELLKK